MSHKLPLVKWHCKYCKKTKYLKPYVASRRTYCSQKCNGLDHLQQHKETLNRVRPTSEQARQTALRIYIENPEIKKERTDITVEKINVDTSPEIANQYGVLSIPTIVIEKDGKEVNRVTGAVAKSKILAIL